MLTYTTDKRAGFSFKAAFHQPHSSWRAQPLQIQQILRSPSLQPKLSIVGAPNDKYEQEADRVADQVMRMPSPSVSHAGDVQRTCAPCAKEYQAAGGENRAVQPGNLCPKCRDQEEGVIQAKLLVPELQRQEIGEDEEERLQTKSAGSYAAEVGGDIQSLQGGGRPLSLQERGFFESRLGADLSNVRLHSDSRAATAARAVNARAFTVGQNVAFGSGEYAPGTREGKWLMAHELVHTIQQGRAKPATPAVQRLGANPSCTTAEADKVHQAIYDARGWLNKAIPKLEATPLAAGAASSLRRNFASTYGVAVNAELIRNRLRVARRALGTIPFSCDTPGTTPFCAANHCGWATVGSNAATICTNPTSTLDIAFPFAPRCVLHESLHAAMSFMTEDVYTDDAAYPGAGMVPLKNPASYTQLTMDLS